MRCPSCQTENPATRKFCRECGGKLLVICPECKFENMPGDKFCGECGRPVNPTCAPVIKEMSLDEKISKIQKYLLEGLTEKILSQRDRIEGEKSWSRSCSAIWRGIPRFLRNRWPKRGKILAQARRT